MSPEGGIAEANPTVTPGEPDVKVGTVEAADLVIEFSDVIRQALDLWAPSCKGDLASAVRGVEWPQARLARVGDWSGDRRCQLCLGEVRNLAHRLEC